MALFFVEKGGDRAPIDYVAAMNGGLRLVPAGASRDALADDYARMVAGGLLLEEAESFESLMDRCSALQEQANAKR